MEKLINVKCEDSQSALAPCSYLVEFEINVPYLFDFNKITGLKSKCMSESKLTKRKTCFMKVPGSFCEKMYISDLGISCF